MEKIVARAFSFLFHPLIMTTLGMVILLNSGTSLSVLQPEVKRVSVVVTVLFTFVFPASMIILLYLSRVIDNAELHEWKDRILPAALTVIIYLILLFVMRKIPQLSPVHILFLSCPPVALLAALAFSRVLNPSIHMLGIGFLLGAVLVLILVYGAALQVVFILVALSAGLLGTSRLLLMQHTPGEVLAGFGIGFLVTVLLLLLFVLSAISS